MLSVPPLILNHSSSPSLTQSLLPRSSHPLAYVLFLAISRRTVDMIFMRGNFFEIRGWGLHFLLVYATFRHLKWGRCNYDVKCGCFAHSYAHILRIGYLTASAAFVC